MRYIGKSEIINKMTLNMITEEGYFDIVFRSICFIYCNQQKAIII